MGNTQKGYLVFMRGEKGAEVERYNHYRDNVLLPFVNDTRK